MKDSEPLKHFNLFRKPDKMINLRNRCFILETKLSIILFMIREGCVSTYKSLISHNSNK